MKKEEEELTYGEVLEARKIKYLNEYSEILRNSELRTIDLENGILTDEFFKREDIGQNKKDILLKLTEDLKNNLI